MPDDSTTDRVACDGDKVTLSYRIMGRPQSSTIRLARLGPIKVSHDRDDRLSMTLEGGFGTRRSLKGLSLQEVATYVRLLAGHRSDLTVEVEASDVATSLDAMTLGAVVLDVAATKAAEDAAESELKADKEAQKEVQKAAESELKADKEAQKEVQKAARRAQLIQRINARQQARGPQVQVKTYKSAKEYQRDAQRMLATGWSSDDVSARTKNWSMTTGFLTNKGITTVTWVKRPQATVATPPVPQSPTPPAADPRVGEDVPRMLRDLAGLRDAGILTAHEFDLKKAELLARM